jgi:hypothetical protein
MKNQFQNLFFYSIYAIVTVIGLNCINISITHKCNDSISVKLDADLDTTVKAPYGVKIDLPTPIVVMTR